MTASSAATSRAPLPRLGAQDKEARVPENTAFVLVLPTCTRMYIHTEVHKRRHMYMNMYILQNMLCTLHFAYYVLHITYVLSSLTQRFLKTCRFLHSGVLHVRQQFSGLYKWRAFFIGLARLLGFTLWKMYSQTQGLHRTVNHWPLVSCGSFQRPGPYFKPQKIGPLS